MSPEIVILLSGILLSIAAGTLGNFLVLQRMSMMTDAIAHGILPGVVCAYFFSHDYNFFLVITFSLLSSFFVAGFIYFLTHKARIKKDAAIGITYATAFSIGILLISQFFQNIHVDAACVLYGEIEYAPFEFLFIGEQNWGPLSLWIMGGISVVNVCFVALFWKEIKLHSFDSQLAYMSKFSPVVLQLCFMGLLSITGVGALTLVGIVLFISFVVVPPVTARLFCTKNVQTYFAPTVFNMFWISIVFGILGVVFGFYFAIFVNTSISGSMAIVNGLLFGVVFFWYRFSHMFGKY